MTTSNYACLGRRVKISYESLSRYLDGFEVDPDLIQLPNVNSLTIEIRLAVFQTIHSPITKYALAFAFDREKKNRLVHLNSFVIKEVCSYLIQERIVDSTDWVLLVGKEGSRVENQVDVCFQKLGVKKVVVLDFGKTPLVEFLKEVTSDIDRVEARKRSLSDPVRADLTSLPTSEKKIRDSEEGKQVSVVFANQLLQLPGITEPIALALVEHFGTPLSLMKALETDDPLDRFTYIQKGETRKANIRVKNGIRRIFKMTADPNETIK